MKNIVEACARIGVACLARDFCVGLRLWADPMPELVAGAGALVLEWQ